MVVYSECLKSVAKKLTKARKLGTCFTLIQEYPNLKFKGKRSGVCCWRHGGPGGDCGGGRHGVRF